MNKTNLPQKKPLADAVAGAMEFAGFDDWFEIFRAGTQTDSQGRIKTFTDADLDSIVANHNADDPAPLVVGHPKTNDPAYGWTQSLKRDGNTLFAKATDVVAEFEDSVKAKNYRKRSVSIEPDGAGGYRLRHIGFLGAAAPAVPGLADLQFSDDTQTAVFEFSVDEAVRSAGWGFGTLTRTLRRFREYLIADKGLEEADDILPNYEIDSLQTRADQIENSLNQSQRSRQFSCQDDEDKPMTITQEQMDAETHRANQAVQQLKALQYQQRVSEAQTLVSGLVTDGKLLPAQAVGLAEFMASLKDQTETFEFSASEGEQPKKQTPHDFMTGFMKSLGKQVVTGKDDSEDAGDTASDYTAPNGYTVDPDKAKLHKQALEYSQKNGVDYSQAISVLTKE